MYSSSSTIVDTCVCAYLQHLLVFSVSRRLVEQEGAGLELHLLDQLSLLLQPRLRGLRLVHPLTLPVRGGVCVCSVPQ